MNPRKLLKAIVIPVTEAAVLLPIILFAVLSTIGMSGGVFGFMILILLLPPVFRYFVVVLDATAKGENPPPLDAEFFGWVGNAWAIFPLPLVVLIGWATFTIDARFGDGAAMLMLFAASALVPASLVVLVVTRSPLQSLNPVAIARLWKTCGRTFWIASIYLFFVGWVLLHLDALPLLLGNLLRFTLLFSFFSLAGTLVEPYGLVDDVYIPDALEPGDDEIRSDIEQAREQAASHAYGFISRGNRDGGFKHIIDYIATDPDPAEAWSWFFGRMLGWEDQRHALFFAQHHIHDQLAHGEDVPAIKTMMRCRLIDEQFRPFGEDLPAAVRAAENSGNTEFAAVLKQR